MSMQWLGWMPERESLLQQMEPGINNLLQVLLLQREREQEIANQVYEATNWQIYDLVTNQGFDVADAVDLARAELERHPEWEQIRKSMETYTPHAIGSDGEGGVTFRYTPPRDILIMQAETEQQQIIQNHQAELEAEADYRRYGLDENRAQFDHGLNKEMTYLVHGLERENMDLSLDHQKELIRLEDELNRAMLSFNLEETHRLSLEMEQFLHGLGLEDMAQEFQYQTMLNAQLGAIEEGHMLVDRETRDYLQNQANTLELARMKSAQGLEQESAKFYDQLERDRELWRDERITRPAEERAEAMQARLMELDSQLQEGRIVLEGDQTLRVQDARNTHELLQQAIAHGNDQEILRLQSDLQREIIALEVELQLGSSMELEAFKNLMVQANMELEYGYTENLATHQANLQYLLQSNLITDQGAMNMIEDYQRHLNSLDYLKQQGAQDIELQTHHQQFQATQADIDRGISQDIPMNEWLTLYDQILTSRQDQLGEVTDDDRQEALYLTADRLATYNPDGSSNREEIIDFLIPRISYLPNVPPVVKEDEDRLVERGIIPERSVVFKDKPSLTQRGLTAVERGMRGPSDYFSALGSALASGNWWDSERSIIDNLNPMHGINLMRGAYSSNPLVDALYREPLTSEEEERLRKSGVR